MFSKRVTLLFALLALIGCSRAANSKLQTIYQWQQIDFKFNTVEERQAAIDTQEFIPRNVIPVAMEVVGNRMYLTLPRLKPGVPATLAYADLTELATTQSPLLMPYPSWQAHKSLSANNPMEIVSPITIRGDRCGHLWVLDADSEGNTQLLGYDEPTGNLFERFNISRDQLGATKDNFTSMVVDDTNCAKLFVYIAAPSAPALIVYSLTEKKTWRVNHHFFHPDPIHGNFSAGNIKYQLNAGVYGLALSDPMTNGFADLYFHPLSSLDEFKVSTAILRNESLATSNAIYKNFTVLGKRPANGQSGPSVFDHKSGVVFYALPNLNEIACWKTSNNYSVTNVYSDAVDIDFPGDIRVTDKGQVWVLTNKKPQFLHGQWNENLVNFRILRGSVKELIKDTACEKTIIEKITKLGEKILPSTSKEPNHSDHVRPYGLTVSILSLLMVIKAYIL